MQCDRVCLCGVVWRRAIACRVCFSDVRGVDVEWNKRCGVVPTDEDIIVALHRVWSGATVQWCRSDAAKCWWCIVVRAVWSGRVWKSDSEMWCGSRGFVWEKRHPVLTGGEVP